MGKVVREHKTSKIILIYREEKLVAMILLVLGYCNIVGSVADKPIKKSVLIICKTNPFSDHTQH